MNNRLFYPPHPSFDQQFQIRRTRLVMFEAVLKRVLKVPDLKTLGTPSVVTIEKRAMSLCTRHNRAQRRQ